MNYRKKIFLLSGAAAFLVFIYVLTFVFDRGRAETRRSSYAWTSRAILENADRVEIMGMAGPVILERKNNVWVMPLSSAGITGDYPVKQSRVEDLFNALSRRSSYPIRSISGPASSSPASGSLEKLGLDEIRSSRIRVRGGAGLPLLDMLIGFGGSGGSTVYFRRAGSNEARSGEDIFSLYTETGIKPWLDFRLFQNISIEDIQRVRVEPPAGSGSASFILSRSGRAWVFSSGAASALSRPVERTKAESYIRSVIGAEAEDFEYGLKNDASIFAGDEAGRITLETGDGALITLRTGNYTESGNRPASVNNSALVYSLARWTFDRLFPAAVPGID